MKINLNNINFNKLPSLKEKSEGSLDLRTNDNINQTPQKVYASNVCFKGGVPLTQLVGEYKSLVKPGTKKAFNSFLEMEMPKESAENLLRFILSDEKLSYDFFDSLTDQLRSNGRFYKELTQKLPSTSEILNLSHPFSPYYTSYEKYINTLYKNSDSVSSLLKIRPDWNEDVLLKKHRELYGNDSFEIGEVPNSIGKENFQSLIEYLRTHSQFGFKMHKDIPDLQLNGNTFKIKALIDGKSDKNVFQVESENGHKYIFKIASIKDRSLDDAFALGTLAKIDTYLTRNNCRNSAPIRYYNHDTNVAIYDFINHEKVPRTSDVSASGRKIPDLYNLGIRQNDTVGSNNYFKLNDTQDCMKKAFDFQYGVEHEELVSVDNDHATFINYLAPKINGFHKELPNAMLGMFF